MSRVAFADPRRLAVQRHERAAGLLTGHDGRHRAGTVFDVDAHVANEPTRAANQDEIRRLRVLAQELHSTLARIDVNSP